MNLRFFVAVLFAVGLALFLPASAFAKEEVFPEQNCAVTIPDGWTRVTDLPNQPGAFGIYRSADELAMLVLMMDPKNKPDRPIDDYFVAEFEKGVKASGGGDRISGRFIEVGGLKGYERVGRVSVQGTAISNVMYAVAADNQFYCLQVMRFDGGEAANSPELQQILSSFRFLQPATPPSAAMAQRNAAYRVGRLIGGASVLIVVGLVILAVIVGIIIVVMKVSSRKKDASTLPPPPSPSPPPLP